MSKLDEIRARDEWFAENPRTAREATDSAQIDRRHLLSLVDELRAALRTSTVALDDWLNTYAAEFCDEKRVEEALARISLHGTIGYIAKTQEAARAALARLES